MSAVFHQGEGVMLSFRIIEPIYGEVPLRYYDIEAHIYDRYGKEVLTTEENGVDIITDGDMVYIFISKAKTETMEGIYFGKVELRYNKQLLYTNELNNFEIIR
jgi:hypothetical protein